MYLQRIQFAGDSNGIANQVQLHIQQSVVFDPSHTEICYKHHENCLQNHINTYSISTQTHNLITREKLKVKAQLK